MARTLTRSPAQQSGKMAFRDLVKAYGGQEAVAEETGVRRQKISDMGLPNVADYPTLDLIDHLEDRTHGTAGWPLVTSWLCRRRGGVFVPLPMGEDDAEGMIRTVAEMAAEFGDVSRAVADAVCPHGPDGEEVNDSEARVALAALDDLDRVSAQLRLKLAARVKGE